MENRLREGGRQINCIMLKTNFLLYTSSEHTVVRSLKSVCGGVYTCVRACVCVCVCVCYNLSRNYSCSCSDRVNIKLWAEFNIWTRRCVLKKDFPLKEIWQWENRTSD